jgi:P-type conjugative transfer protein TrbJ
MKGTDYSQQVWTMMDQTSNAIYDAMQAQGLVAQIGDDHQNLQTLLNCSATAEGALSASQAGNQILGVICEQIFKMETIMSESYRAELSYENQILQQQAASDVSKALTVTPQPTNPNGKGYGKWDEN